MVRAYVVMMAVVSSGAIAQVAAKPTEQQVVPASENAALRYWEAWWELGPDAFPSFFDRIRLIDTKTGEPVDHPEPEPPSERGIEMIIKAASMPLCDFGVDLDIFASGDPDESLVLSHYWLLLKSYGLLLEEAKKCLDSGNPEEAAELYLASLFMIDHATQQSDLVTFGLAVAFTETVDEIKERQGEFNRSEREIIAQAVSRFDSEDPFRIVWGFRLFTIAYANSIRSGTAENEEGLDPENLDRIAEFFSDFMDAAREQDDKLWNRLGMDRQNLTRNEFEPLILELRAQEAKAIEALNWLRGWSSN